MRHCVGGPRRQRLGTPESLADRRKVFSLDTPDTRFENACILLVDDEEANIELLRRILAPMGYENLRTTTDPTAVASIVEEEKPDLILLDLMMPGMDGFEVMEKIRDKVPDDVYLPILVLTSDGHRDTRRRALSGGAKDFLTKPLSASEVRLRVRNLLETRFLHRALREQNHFLEERVRERTEDLELARLEILSRLAEAAEYRDDSTGEHTRRVGRMSGAIAAALGLPPSQVKLLRTVAPLHDVGKIGVPDRILLHPSSLSPQDFEVMKTHTLIGGRLLGGSEFPVLETAAEIALSHHERWDGGGYPHGYQGSEIPLSGRIVSVADTYDALRFKRPYKPAWTHQQALAEIEANRGGRYDPEVVDAFRMVVHREGASIEV
jgi:putative two-component system response regulator